MDFKTFWNWLVTSSAGPEKTSLAIKGFLVLGSAYLLHITTLSCDLHLYCAYVDQNMVDSGIALIVTLIQAGLTLVGALMGLYGLIRKVQLGKWSASQ